MLEKYAFSQFLPEHIDYCQKRFSRENLNNNAIIEYAEALCNMGQLLSPDIEEINTLIEKLTDKNEYAKFQTTHQFDDTKDPSYITHFFAESLVLYLHDESSTLDQVYQADKEREGIIQVVVKKNTQCDDILRHISINEKTSLFSLENILEIENVNPALRIYVRQNLHQRAILSLIWLTDLVINAADACPAGYPRETVNKFINEYTNKKLEIKLIFYSEHNNILRIEINSNREKNEQEILDSKDFVAKYILEITDFNKKDEEKKSNIKVKLIDYQFQVANQYFYKFLIKYKLDLIVQKIISQETLTIKDQKDIQSLLVPYLKVESGKKVLRDPKKIEDHNILLLLYSQDYTTEANDEIKKRKFSEREKIRYATLLNRANKLNRLFQENDEEENKTSRSVSTVRDIPINECVDNANKKLPWWLRVSEVILPNFILGNISIFRPIFTKNKARTELIKVKIDEYLDFLSTANSTDADNLWKEKDFINKAKNLITEMNQKIQLFKQNKQKIKRIALEEPLLTHFLKLSSISNKLNNKKFINLEAITLHLVESIFSSVEKVFTPKDEDFKQLAFFKILLKSDKFYLLCHCKNYNNLLSKWVQIYKDPELIRLVLKRKEILQLLDVPTLSEIIAIADQTDTIIDIKNIDKTSLLIQAIFLSVDNISVPADKKLKPLDYFKNLLKSDELFLLFMSSVMPKDYDTYNNLLSKWVDIYKDSELIQLLLNRKEILELMDASTLSKIIDIADKTDTTIDLEKINNTSNYTIFTHQVDNATSVHVAGNFNQWLNSENHIIQDNPQWSMKNRNGTWTLLAKLNPGTYEFKYVVNNNNWERDKNLSIHIPEPYQRQIVETTSNLINSSFQGITREIQPPENSLSIVRDENKIYDFFMPKNQLNFNEWYIPETFNILNRVKNTANLLIIQFYDVEENGSNLFDTQLCKLQEFAKTQGKLALFISKEPGVQNHFICGVLNNDELLLINPLGITDKQICYDTLAKLQQSNRFKKIFLAQDKLQQHSFEENGLVSCGPMTLELALYILSLTPSRIKLFWEELNLKSLLSPTCCTPHSDLKYASVSIKPILPDTLKSFLNPHLSQSIYEQRICAIRKSHYYTIKTLAEKMARNNQTTVEKYLEELKSEIPIQTDFLEALAGEKTMIKSEINDTPPLRQPGVGVGLDSKSESELKSDSDNYNQTDYSESSSSEESQTNNELKKDTSEVRISPGV